MVELTPDVEENPSNVVLTTYLPYYTATGSTDSDWTLNELCIETEPDLNGDELEVKLLTYQFGKYML